ncbi:hypothetical protein GDO81_006755 [Engystomops pustulosus]|uniref:Uncharacterized protein n=1 Tax=Engystomops pustulosus TaxID=76066 RepID=A0AAV7CZ51_ENGPU|nr:hypothetical protein GDO81_006755 [Engystomops pustulosus]
MISTWYIDFVKSKCVGVWVSTYIHCGILNLNKLTILLFVGVLDRNLFLLLWHLLRGVRLCTFRMWKDHVSWIDDSASSPCHSVTLWKL